MSNQLQLAVNHALALRERAQYLQRAGMAADAKRPAAWCEYGYPSEVSFDDFYKLYERHGIAHGVVELLVEKCWQTAPEVIEGAESERAEDVTAWEDSVRKLFKSVQMWRGAQSADRRRLVGRYAGLILLVADGQDLSQPVTPRAKLERVLAAWEGQLTPSTWDTVPTSPTYGQVTSWTYSEFAVDRPDNAAASQVRGVTIHHSRVVVFGDVREGVPLLRAGYNDFVNLEKVLGGSGESFLKNASRQVNINFDKDTDLARIAQAYGVGLDELQEIFNQTARDLNQGLDLALVTQGAQVSPLVSTVPDPEKPFNVALQSACASVRIPTKIVVGMQTGERASTEDQRQFNQRCQGRRLGDLTADLERLVAHLITWKLLDAPAGGEFSIVWDDLTEATATERLENALKMADVNAKNAATGAAIFTDGEIREAAGYEPEVDVEVLPDEEPDEDDA